MPGGAHGGSDVRAPSGLRDVPRSFRLEERALFEGMGVLARAPESAFTRSLLDIVNENRTGMVMIGSSPGRVAKGDSKTRLTACAGTRGSRR